jgi:hypothetical protein
LRLKKALGSCRIPFPSFSANEQSAVQAEEALHLSPGDL